jgi:pimeloyl-ACP methyl ester carboxylesterase
VPALFVRRLDLRHLAALAASAVAAAGCDSGSPASSGDSGGDGAVTQEATIGGDYVPEGNPCTDSIASIYGDPGPSFASQPKGAILKCYHDQDLSAAALLAAARAGNDAGSGGYMGRPFTSGAHVYRVLYRTERGDTGGSPGYSSALVLLPDTPRAPRSPVVVASHGSRGQAAHCAPSLLDDPAAADVNADFVDQVYPLVGLGFAVIAPDLAGYANFGASGNPPSAYAGAADVGKSTLDGARALRQLIPSSVTEQVVLVGHSQGGHTALAALSMADSYGADGVIAGVAVYAPLWFSQRSWGAIFLEPSKFAFAASAGGAVSVWYHYTHEALLDQGTFSVFSPSELPAVTSFVDSDCWQSSYPDLEALGPNANVLFTPSYQSSIESGVVPGAGCASGDQVCQTWVERMTADWPHLTGGAAKTPILLLYAEADSTITPDLMACVFRRLSGDGANYSVCYDADPVGHSGIVEAKADSVADWIAAQTQGAPGPDGGCQLLATDDGGVPVLTDPEGGVIPCNELEPTQ